MAKGNGVADIKTQSNTPSNSTYLSGGTGITMFSTVRCTVCFTGIIICVIIREACKSTFARRTRISGICNITFYTMRTAVHCAICFTGIAIYMKIRFACRDLAKTIGFASSGSCIVCECIAVLTGRTAMGIVIYTNQSLISHFGLIADISFTLFVYTHSGGTNLFSIARLAGTAIGAACRAALGIGTLILQRIQAITVLAGCGDTFPVFTYPCIPSCYLCAIGIRFAAVCRRVGYTFAVFDMGIGLAFRGLANAVHAVSCFCIFERIAIHRSGCLSIGTSRVTV